MPVLKVVALVVFDQIETCISSKFVQIEDSRPIPRAPLSRL
jgi:hypothetical protein